MAGSGKTVRNSSRAKSYLAACMATLPIARRLSRRVALLFTGRLFPIGRSQPDSGKIANAEIHFTRL